MKVYVASSWRNPHQQFVVEALRDAGHEVYDFRNPPHGGGGFAWSDIDTDWQEWSPGEYRDCLDHERAEAGFKSDMDALRWCDACVYVLPCGRSASLELGWACGAGKTTVVLLADAEPELMVKMADHICLDLGEVVEALAAERCTTCGGLGWVQDISTIYSAGPARSLRCPACWESRGEPTP